MRLPIYQVDAFTAQLFAGNPAAVVLCGTTLLADDVMQAIAAENNLSETAYVSGVRDSLAIRWFTPTVEVDLCGHATLAAAHVLYELHGDDIGALAFASRSGPLYVRKMGGRLWLDFPADRITPEPQSRDLLAVALGQPPLEVYRGRDDILAILADEHAVATLQPDFGRIAQLPCRGVIVAARGTSAAFVSRFFAPQSGVAEDPVTGSAHTTLTPYWSERLGLKEMDALQLSPRGGALRCVDRGDRVHIGGNAVTYLRGEITL